MRDVVEDVETRDALVGQQLCRMALRLLENRREDVAGVRFVALRALDVQNRRLQDAAKRHRLLGLPLRPAALALDRFVEVRVERAPQRRQVRAAGREDALAVRIVRERVEQVLEREIGVPPRDRFAERDDAARLQERVKTRSSITSRVFDGGLQRVPGLARARQRACRLWFPRLPTGRCRPRRGR